ncbi:MAG: VCBS repeat-containing protein [Saprospiraceae bacterium]
MVIKKTGLWFACLVFGLLVWRCASPSNEQAEKETLVSLTLDSAQLAEAQLLASSYCAACHEWVKPEVLPKSYWEQGVLPKMGRYLGIQEDPNAKVESPIARERLAKAKLFPTAAILPLSDWQKIKAYYLSQAPTATPAESRPPIDLNLSQFAASALPWKTPAYGPTALKIVNHNMIVVGYRVFLAGDISEQLIIINPAGQVINHLSLPSTLSDIGVQNGTLSLSLMGSFEGNDEPSGAIASVAFGGQGIAGPLALQLEGRERPVHTTIADLDGDGREDLLVSEFGTELGGLNIYWNKGGSYQRFSLYNKAGTVKTIVKDANKDGLPDIYALTAQGNEGILLYLNQGKGQFVAQQLLTFPPYYGSTYFELVDFDGDGLEDILYTCGDSGDFGWPAKAFHGIRLFKQKEANVFEEEWFYPQEGTYKAMARDFDEDGDQDIVSIAFYAYHAGNPQEGFLYLENKGNRDKEPNFKTYSFPQAAAASWLVMDVGDLDQDGDLDVILGANSAFLGDEKVLELLLEWQERGGAVMVLENRAR